MFLKKIITALVVASALLVGGASESSAAVTAHSVEKGDSLYKISGMHGVSVSNLMKWNKLGSTVIYPNQKLVVANAGSTNSTIKSTTKNTAKSNSVSVHKVKRGDSLFKISRMYNVSIANLKSWNNLNTTIIHPNQELNTTGVASSVQKKSVAPKAAQKTTQKAAKKVTQKTPSRSNQAKATKEFTVSATAYTASCTGCSGITKTGINLKRNPGLKVIAVDPSVIKLGTKVHVEGYGYAVAGDIGGAIKGNKIDVFIPTKAAAYKWGRKNVKITILD